MDSSPTWNYVSFSISIALTAPSDGLCSDLVGWIPPAEARPIAMAVLYYERLGWARQDINQARPSERRLHLVDEIGKLEVDL